jgi:Response regulator containing a CheY-like receiver domain and an HTH DNA-binding domain
MQELKERVALNTESFKINIDSAYKELDFLVEQSEFLGDTTSLLLLSDRRCRYFYNKHNVEELLASSKTFMDKAYEYESPNDQVMSGIYLAEAYSMNDLNDNSLRELEKAMLVMEKREPKTLKDIVTKVNLLSSFANTYEQMHESEIAVKYLRAANDEFIKVDDPERVKRFQHVNFSNLANTYLNYNLDSAVYFATLSMNVFPEEELQDTKIIAQNYYILGKGFEEEKQYQSALDYYQKAYNLYIDNGIELNVKALYMSMIDIYNLLGDSITAKEYADLLNEYELKTLQTKYSSMHKLYLEQESQTGEEESNSNLAIIIALVITALLILFGIFFFIYQRKKGKETRAEHYDTLMELIGKNNSDFMILFDEIYPDFTKKLLSINPDLSRSEIEFCAFLKLNLSTKQISQMRFIEIRTVQNRKYRIRKRLDIPSNADLYNWFDAI